MALMTRAKPASRDLPIAAACLAIVTWAIGPLFVRAFDVSTPTILFYRVLVALPVMIGASFVFGDGISLRALRVSVLPGVLFGLSIMTSFASYRETAIVNATIIQSLSPALVLLVAGWLFGERRTPRQLRLAIVSFAGVAIVILAGSDGFGAVRRGDLFALANLVVWTAYFLRLKHVRSTAEVDSWSLIAAIFVVAAVVIVPWAATVSNDLGAMRARDWWLCISLVLVVSLVGHGLMTWAQRDLDVTLTSLLSLASAPITTLGAWIVFGQSLHLGQIVGSAIVLAALALIMLDRPAADSRS